MAVTAKFQADFTSFQQAVSKAELSLRSFETGAGRVEKSLNRMGDSFSGVKIIQEANLLAKAMGGVEGASKLTASEQQRVNATVTEALAKYKALGMEAPKSLTDIAEATRKVEQPMSMAARATDLLKSSFAQFTAANLAASAIQSVTGEVQRFIGQGVQLRGIETSFDRLNRGVHQNSTDMLRSLQEGTRGMVSNFDLMTQANKALLLGLPVTADSMGELAKTASVLGKAMGQDATQSLNDLITALGRSSPMILDNLGLTVKIGDANDAYAKKLGKTSEQLTESEKKLAFYEAAMEAARKKTHELGEQTKTLGEIATTVWTSTGNVVASAASAINVGAGRAVSSWSGFFQFLQDSITSGSGQAIVMADFRAAAEAYAKTLRTDVNLELPKTTAATQTLTKANKDAAKTMRELADAAAEMVERGIKKQTAALREQFGSGVLQGLHQALAANRTEWMLIPPVQRDVAAANEHTTATLQAMIEAGMRLPPITEAQIKSFTKAQAVTVTWREELAELATAMTQLSQTAGNDLISGLASMVNAVNVGTKAISTLKGGFDQLTSGGGIKSILGGFTGIVSGIGGIVSAAQTAIQIGKVLFNLFDRDKGRDLVEQFAAEFAGGFDGPNGLHEALLQLGDEGERLWIMLTQGVGRNNPDQARKAIEEVREALERYKASAASVPPVTFEINRIERTENRGEVEQEGENSFAGGTGGFKWFGKGRRVTLHGWEAVVRPGDKMPGGGSSDQPIVINLAAGVYDAQRIVVDAMSRAHRVKTRVGAR